MERLKHSWILIAGLMLLASCKPETLPQEPVVTPELHENFTLPPEPEPVKKSAPGISMNGSIGAVDILPLTAGQRAIYNETLGLGSSKQQRLLEFSVVGEKYNNTDCIGWEKAVLGLEERAPEIKRIWCGSLQFDFMWNETWSLREISTFSNNPLDRNVHTKSAEDVTNFTVPAGRFEALRAATRTSERVLLEWYSPEVPITGIVRLQEDRKNYHRTFELVRVEK